MSSKKIHSVLELAKYHIGDKKWWVVLRAKAEAIEFEADYSWMQGCHPKIFFDRGYGTTAWPSGHSLPKLKTSDFSIIVGMLTSDIVTEQFVIADIKRSPHTGEFIYYNSENEGMPEDYLCDSQNAVATERKRILELIGLWVTQQVAIHN